MRPIQLRMQGLRSYRTDTTIDFSDVELMGIIGATGSGKSSILEGICYALFGLPTDGNEVRELISQGLNTMSVELTFSADGQRWQTYRTTSHTSQAPSARLKSLSDDGFVQIDGGRLVTAAIEKLIGLDRDQFLKSVILPQGRFAELLDARDAPRATILKGIFRLDVLDVVRDVATRTRDEVDGYLHAFELERAAFMRDPAAVATASADEAKTAHAEAEKLRASQREIQKLNAEANGAEQTAGRLATLAEAIERCLTEKPSQQIEALGSVARSIEMEEARLSTERVKAVARVSIAAAAVKKLDDKGRGARAMDLVVQALTDLSDGSAENRSESRRLDQEQTTLKAHAKELESETKKLSVLEKQKAPLIRQREQAARNTAQTESNRTRALERLRTVRQAADDLLDRKGRLDKAISEATDAAESAGKAASKLKDTNARRIAAEAEMARLQRQHAAEDAAAGLKPGDPCPICNSTLPKGFRPPKASSLEDAKGQVSDAVDAFAAAQLADANAKASQRSLHESSTTLATDRDQAVKALAKVKTALDALLPAPSDLTKDDATILRPVARAHADAIKAQEDADAAIRTLDAHLTPVGASVGMLTRLVQDGTENLARRRLELENRAAVHESQRLAIPEAFRPASLTSGEMTAIRTRARAAAEVAREKASHLALAQSALAELQTQRDEVAKRRHSELEKPLEPLRGTLANLRLRVDDAKDSAPVGLPAQVGAGVPMATLLAYSTKLEAAGTNQAAAMRSAESTATKLAGTKRAATQGLLGKHACKDLDALTNAIAGVMATEKIASERETLARAEMIRANELDAVITPAAELRDALKDLARLLAPGAFVDFVVKRKQRTLLAIASDILQEMTGKRFGFSADFQIVDSETGQARSPRTLSGGERFLASLALSLALVELAARGGGRLDSLFLDEGFGSLDNDSLEDALEALERVAGHGRMIALITHIRAVADRLPRVLKISKAPGGSQAHWLSQVESDAEVEAELSEGMLT